MKIQCSSCSARYAVADDKVRGKNVAIRCKRCGERIALRAEAPADWHVSEGGARSGPFGLEVLRERLASGAIGAAAHVWREGMGDWTIASEVDELADLFTAAAPAPSLTGGRAETSVLFSLSNLRELSRPAASPEPARPSDGSGLIDIRALAEVVATAPSAPAADELLAFGGSELASPLGAPVILPERARAPSRTPILVGSGVALAAALAAAVVVAIVELRPEPPSAPAASIDREARAEPPATPRPAAIDAPQAPSAIDPAEPPPVVAPSPRVTPSPPIAAPRPRPVRPRPPAPATEEPAARPRPPAAPIEDDPLARIFDDERPAPVAPPARTLPATPSRADVVGAMRALEAPVRACGDGNATVHFRFDSDGSVASATVDGTLPPEARTCVARAARGARVPAFARDSFSVTYPFRL